MEIWHPRFAEWKKEYDQIPWELRQLPSRLDRTPAATVFSVVSTVLGEPLTLPKNIDYYQPVRAAYALEGFLNLTNE